MFHQNIVIPSNLHPWELHIFQQFYHMFSHFIPRGFENFARTLQDTRAGIACWEDSLVKDHLSLVFREDQTWWNTMEHRTCSVCCRFAEILWAVSAVWSRRYANLHSLTTAIRLYPHLVDHVSKMTSISYRRNLWTFPSIGNFAEFSFPTAHGIDMQPHEFAWEPRNVSDLQVRHDRRFTSLLDLLLAVGGDLPFTPLKNKWSQMC